MHSAPSEPSSAARPVLDVATICKADHWVDDVLPRFAALVDANCTGHVRRHLLLLVPPPGGPDGQAETERVGRIEERLRGAWHSVVSLPFEDRHPGRRLLAFDELRAGLTAFLELEELLYTDPDTDVVGDLQGVQGIAPGADLLWAANPLPLQPFVAYERDVPRIVVHPHPAPLPAAAEPRDPAAPPAALCVIALYRDNADYLPHALSRFAAWERAGLPVRYHFLENDSLDATAPLLGEFMRGRRGRLSTKSLAIRYHRARSGQNYDRVMPLARMRNFVVDAALADAPLAADEWTLLVDSDIFFPEDILERVFAARAADPRPDSIGMLTCYTQQLFLPDQMVVGSPAPDMPGYVLADHYFDTFAFQDADHCHHHPYCCFTRCRRCRLGRPPDHPQRLVGEGVPILDVAAAFGGFALLPTRLLADGRIRWSTYATGFDRARALSEHVVFCDRLRTITGKRVVVLQDVDCVYRK